MRGARWMICHGGRERDDCSPLAAAAVGDARLGVQRALAQGHPPRLALRLRLLLLGRERGLLAPASLRHEEQVSDASSCPRACHLLWRDPSAPRAPSLVARRRRDVRLTLGSRPKATQAVHTTSCWGVGPWYCDDAHASCLCTGNKLRAGDRVRPGGTREQ